MSGWPLVRLADLCELRPQKAEVRRRLKPEDLVSFVPMNDLPDSAMWLEAKDTRTLASVEGSYTYFADGDVLLAKITPCFENGKLGVARGLRNGMGFGSSEFFVLRASKRLLPEYLFYFLSRLDFRAQGAAVMRGAVGHRRVPNEFIEECHIPLPSVAEQKQLVSKLGQALEGISRATRNAERNLANAQVLFSSTLDAALSGSTGELMSIGALVDRGVLDRPLDGNHGDIHPKKADFVDAGVPFIMASDLVDGIVDQHQCHFISEQQASSLRKGFAKDGDVLISHKGTIGRVALLRTERPFVMLTPQVTYYRTLDPEALLNRYVYFALQGQRFQAEMARIAGAGSTRAYIGILKQLDLCIVVPDIDQQREITARLEVVAGETRRLIGHYKRRVASLAELREEILRSAFAGQLRSSKALAA